MAFRTVPHGAPENGFKRWAHPLYERIVSASFNCEVINISVSGTSKLVTTGTSVSGARARDRLELAEEAASSGEAE